MIIRRRFLFKRIRLRIRLFIFNLFNRKKEIVAIFIDGCYLYLSLEENCNRSDLYFENISFEEKASGVIEELNVQ